MATPGQLPPVTYRPTQGQRRTQLRGGIMLVALAIFGFIAGPGAGADSRLLLVVGVMSLPLGIFLLAQRSSYTTINAGGLRAWSPLQRHSCRWSEVTGITEAVHRSEGEVRRVRIQCTGRSFVLPAPADSLRKGGDRNPDFEGQLATIMSYWDSARSLQG